eukprot:g15788.t1
MRKVKLGLASAGALSASFLKVFGGGNSQDCNQCNAQHTAPPPLESGSGSPSNAHPFQSSTSFSRVFGSDHETTSSPSFSRVFGFDRTSSPSPSIPTSVFKTEPPVSSLHSTLGFLSKTASTPTPSDEVIDFPPEVVSEIAADHRSGFKTKQEGDNWRTRNRVHNKIHRACRRGSMRRAVEGGKDIQRVTSMTIDMTKPFHLPCLHQATRLGAADEAAEYDSDEQGVHEERKQPAPPSRRRRKRRRIEPAEPEESESESSDEDAPLGLWSQR